MSEVITLNDNDYGSRADVIIAKRLPELSRGYIKRLAQDGKLLLDGKAIQAGYKVRSTSIILFLDYDMSELLNIPKVELDIIYEDEHIIAINKPCGLITHARGKFWNETSIASSIRSYQADQDSSDLRAGIVHRLDRATSGLILCAKDKQTHAHLQKQFSDRTVTKEYRALVSNMDIPDKSHIDRPIGRNPRKPVTFMVHANGKSAQTDYQVMLRGSDNLQLALWPKTGRTHQLRVHLASIDAPIIGDVLYGGKPADRLMLHAYQLTFIHPSTEAKMVLTAELPSEFKL